MKKIFQFAAGIVVIIANGLLNVAAATTTTESEMPSVPTAIIDSNNNVEVNKNTLFDASRSTLEAGDSDADFLWDFGDQSGGSGREIIHTYNKPGTYTVTLRISQANRTTSLQKNIFVYERSQSIFTDPAHNTAELYQTVERLKQKNILANIFDLSSTLDSNDINAVNNSTFVFALTEPGELVRADIQQALKGKTLVLIADGNLRVLERLSKNSFSSVGARKIVLTNNEALLPQNSAEPSILEATNAAELSGIMANRQIPFTEVNTQDTIGLSNFMLAIINFLRLHGMPDASLFLLLCIPLIVTIISFFRQVIGIATLGIFIPTVFTIIFLVIGGLVGGFTFVLIALLSVLLRKVLKQVRIMYVPKMAIVLIGITVAIILLFILATIFNYQGFITIDILPLVFLVTLGERFISLQLERGFRVASMLFFETIVVSMVAYLMLDTQKTAILAYPEITLLMIPLNYVLGKWTGLRISELLRFRELLDSAQRETQD